jgi:hypothetical protein
MQSSRPALFRAALKALWQPLWGKLCYFAGGFSILSEIAYQVVPDHLAEKIPRAYNIAASVGIHMPLWGWFVIALGFLSAAFFEMTYKLWLEVIEFRKQALKAIEFDKSATSRISTLESQMRSYARYAYIHEAEKALRELSVKLREGLRPFEERAHDETFSITKDRRIWHENWEEALEKYLRDIRRASDFGESLYGESPNLCAHPATDVDPDKPVPNEPPMSDGHKRLEYRRLRERYDRTESFIERLLIRIRADKDQHMQSLIEIGRKKDGQSKEG